MGTEVISEPCERYHIAFFKETWVDSINIELNLKEVPTDCNKVNKIEI